MREVIGVWERWPHALVYLEEGVLRFGLPTRDSERPLAFKRKFGARFGGDAEFWVGVDYDSFGRFLFGCKGLSEAEVLKKVAERKAHRDAIRNAERVKDEKWEETREKFDGLVIGIDKSIDVYGTGFSVRVVFSSDVTFMAKAKFLRENRVEFVKWVMNEIAESKKITGRIGSIRFYKPVEIINLRAREVEVKFEVKEGVV